MHKDETIMLAERAKDEGHSLLDVIIRQGARAHGMRLTFSHPLHGLRTRPARAKTLAQTQRPRPAAQSPASRALRGRHRANPSNNQPRNSRLTNPLDPVTIYTGENSETQLLTISTRVYSTAAIQSHAMNVSSRNLHDVGGLGGHIRLAIAVITPGANRSVRA